MTDEILHLMEERKQAKGITEEYHKKDRKIKQKCKKKQKKGGGTRIVTK